MSLRIVEKDERFNEVKQYNLRKHKENEMENFKATVEPNDLGWTNWKNCKQKRIGNDVDNVMQQEFYKIYCKAFIII